MKRLKNGVYLLVQDEYRQAAAKYGELNNSPHESYAVLLEEFEEAKEQLAFIESQLENLWADIKRNQPVESRFKTLIDFAVEAACECIQVAAMAHKASLGYKSELELNGGEGAE